MDEQGSPSFFDTDVLRRLFQQLEATDVDELEVVQGSSRVFLRRDPGKRTVVRDRERPQRRGQQHEGVPIVAPLTGVLYTRPSPEQPPFVTAGGLVEAGQVVALIETMKLFNEVTVEFAGEVVEITAQDGALVEEAQPLMYLVPRQESEEP